MDYAGTQLLWVLICLQEQENKNSNHAEKVDAKSDVINDFHDDSLLVMPLP
jgi:hypothetical protein